MNYHNKFTGQSIHQLQQEIEERRKHLTKVRAVLQEKRAQVHDLVLEENIAKSHLEMLEGFLEQMSGVVFGEDEKLLSEEYASKQQMKMRSPTEMLRPQFKGMQLSFIIELVLDRERKPLTTTEIGRKIYDTNSKEEFSRARNSLSAELRAGASRKPPRWIKKGRNAYAHLSFQVEEEVLDGFSPCSGTGGDACIS